MESSIKAITIILVVIIATESILYFQLQSNYNQLFIVHEELRVEYSELQSLYNELTESYDSLNSSYNSLQNDYNTLSQTYTSIQGQYNSLQNSYNNLQSLYSSLQGDYGDLQSDYEIEKYLTIGNSLESYYDLLRQELGSTGTYRWWTYSQSYWQTAAEFAANLGLHDLRILYWQDIEDEYFNDVGEYSYDTARQKIDEILNLLNIKNYHTSTEKINRVLDFIYNHIHYESEVNDVFLAPVETLGFQSGDCDDFSILAAALFEALEIQSAIGLFKNDNNQYHAMVLIHLEDLGNYGYWYYSDLTNYGLESGRWIEIEPQLPIQQQNDDWLKQWNIVAAAPLDWP